MMQQYQMKITENIPLARDIYRMSLTAEAADLKGFAAGCFVHIKINDGALLLRRPISLYEVAKLRIPSELFIKCWVGGRRC